MKLTQERLKEVLKYDPITGIFTRNCNINRNKFKKGDIVGTVNGGGYLEMWIDKKRYLLHRLAFLYMEGYIPENEVDHKNRNRSCNIWTNLREVSHQCNMRNSKKSKNNTSGVTGVSYNKAKNGWEACICVSGVKKRLGRFPSFHEAVRSRWEAEVKYKFPNCNTISTAYCWLKSQNLI